MKNFNDILKDIRKKQGIAQKTIANDLSIPLRTYQAYEYGEHEPSLTTLKVLADYFNVSTDYLLGRTDEE